MKAEVLAKLLLKNPEAEVEIEVYRDMVWPVSVENTFYNHPSNKVVTIKTSVSEETPELIEARAEAKKYKEIVDDIRKVIKEKY
jgi:hypothetical protein